MVEALCTNPLQASFHFVFEAHQRAYQGAIRVSVRVKEDLEWPINVQPIDVPAIMSLTLLTVSKEVCLCDLLSSMFMR